MFTKNYFSLIPFFLHNDSIDERSSSVKTWTPLGECNSIGSTAGLDTATAIFRYVMNIPSYITFNTLETYYWSVSCPTTISGTCVKNSSYQQPRKYISFSSEVFDGDIYTQTTALPILQGLTFIRGGHDKTVHDGDVVTKTVSILITNKNAEEVTVKSVQATFGADFGKGDYATTSSYMLLFGANLATPITIAPNATAEVCIDFIFDNGTFIPRQAE